MLSGAAAKPEAVQPQTQPSCISSPICTCISSHIPHFHILFRSDQQNVKKIMNKAHLRKKWLEQQRTVGWSMSRALHSRGGFYLSRQLSLDRPPLSATKTSRTPFRAFRTKGGKLSCESICGLSIKGTHYHMK